jgi:TPR repeat protein
MKREFVAWWLGRPAGQGRELTAAHHDHDDDEAMLEPYRPAIRAGVPQALFELGCEREANGCRATWDLWMRRAAVAGHQTAAKVLEDIDGVPARWYWEELPAARDEELYRQAQELEAAGETFEAERTYRRSAEAGNAHAAYRLGRLLRRHRNDQSRKWLGRAQAGGDRFAAVLLSSDRSRSDGDRGGGIRHGFVVGLADAGDVEAAYVVGAANGDRDRLRDAARAGDVDAAFELAGRLRGEAARRWKRLALLGGHPAVASAETTGSWRGDLPAARELWQKEAADGDVAALFNLAVDAERVGRLDDAERLFRAAVAAGDSEAAARLAALLASAGGRCDAEALVRDLADDDVAAACVLGALRYADGDHEAARDLWRPGASAGDVGSAYHLGLFHELDDDWKAALHWYRRAADAGHELAARRSGDLLLAHTPWEDSRTYWELLRRQDRHRAPAWMTDGADLASRYRLTSTTGPGSCDVAGSAPPDLHTSVSQLMLLWDDLQGLVPSRRRAVDFLAHESGLPRRKIDEARRTRNRCAHPGENGWPSADTVARAVNTLQAVRRAVQPEVRDDVVTGAAAVAPPHRSRPVPATLGLSTSWMTSSPPPSVASRGPRERSPSRTAIRLHDRFVDWLVDRSRQTLVTLTIIYGMAMLITCALLWERAPGGQAVGVVLFGATTTTLAMSTVIYCVDSLDIIPWPPDGLGWSLDWDWDDASFGTGMHLLWLAAVWLAAVPFLRVGWVDAWLLVSLPFLLVPYVAWSRVLLILLAPAVIIATLAAPLVILGSAEAVVDAPSGPLGLPATLVDDGTFHRPDR